MKRSFRYWKRWNKTALKKESQAITKSTWVAPGSTTRWWSWNPCGFICGLVAWSSNEFSNSVQKTWFEPVLLTIRYLQAANALRLHLLLRYLLIRESVIQYWTSIKESRISDSGRNRRDPFCPEDTGEEQRRKERAGRTPVGRGEWGRGGRDRRFLGGFEAPAMEQEPRALTAGAAKRAPAAGVRSGGGAASMPRGGGGRRRAQTQRTHRLLQLPGARVSQGALWHSGSEFGDPCLLRDPEAKRGCRGAQGPRFRGRRETPSHSLSGAAAS